MVTTGRSGSARVVPRVRGGLVLSLVVSEATVTAIEGRVPRVTVGRVPLVGGDLDEVGTVSWLYTGGSV